MVLNKRTFVGVVGTKYRVHNKRMFILREFIISELYIIQIQWGEVRDQGVMFIISDPDCILNLVRINIIINII